ncbi:MAG: hypothetical protein QM736_04395 [Vicinamibacterales bacterium]
MRGASGYFLVVDGTRHQTLDTALSLHDAAQEVVPNVPFTLLINKCDLVSQWEIREDLLDVLRQKGWRVIKTSAKNGDDVDQAFIGLARAMVEV